MPPNPSHSWSFRSRFRRNAFGWRSQPAIARISEAVSEIKKVARKDQIAAAEGAVVFLERLSPAIEAVDSSSGAIGNAVNSAICTLVPIIADAPADDDIRSKWLDRLWDAVEADAIPYLELVPDHWGELCATAGHAARWADGLLPVLRTAWGPDPSLRGFFKGATACLSALYKCGRHEEILARLDLEPYKLHSGARAPQAAMKSSPKTSCYRCGKRASAFVRLDTIVDLDRVHSKSARYGQSVEVNRRRQIYALLHRR